MKLEKLEKIEKEISYRFTVVIEGNTVTGELLWSEQQGYDFWGYECSNGAFIFEDWLQEGDNMADLVAEIEAKEDELKNA